MVAVGFALALAGLELPGPIAGLTGFLAAAASPCALFALGTSLAAVPARGGVGEVLLVTAVHLLGHPLLVWLAASFVHPLPEPLLRGALLTAALPTPPPCSSWANAERFPASATIVLVTHAASLLTLSALLVLSTG